MFVSVTKKLVRVPAHQFRRILLYVDTVQVFAKPIKLFRAVLSSGACYSFYCQKICLHIMGNNNSQHNSFWFVGGMLKLKTRSPTTGGRPWMSLYLVILVVLSTYLSSSQAKTPSEWASRTIYQVLTDVSVCFRNRSLKA
jgi:hypothetical protein